MAVLDQKKVIANLCKKGFEERQGGAHRSLNYRALDGRRTSITTHVSRSPQHKVIDDSLAALMAKQCRLPKREFLLFARCEIDQNAYEAILRAAHQL